MRRGLISQARLELPDAVLDARLARVRAGMAEARLDALVLYSNNTRAAGVSWLTGFVPYWSEALLVLVREAPPVLVVALTYRVKSWIERTSRVADVIHGQRIGQEAARVIAGAKADAVVAVPDLDHLPASVADDLRSGGPHLVLTDASSMFAPLRGPADATEIALATKAAWIAQRALACAGPASSGGESLNAIIAATEGEARRLGAEEVYIAAAPDLSRDPRLRRIEGGAPLGKRFALRATVACQGTWIRLVRTFAESELLEAVQRTLASAIASLPDAGGFSGFSSWLVEGCRIAQPLEPLMGSRILIPMPIPSRALVSVQGRLQIADQAVLVGAPALLGLPGEAASLLIQPVFDA
jgi:hypothetical protein